LKTRNIKEIVTHGSAHFDEHVGVILLRMYGEKFFPGISKAPVRLLGSGKLSQGKSVKDFPESLFLGVGEGMFDDHVHGDCCAMLIAKDFKVNEYFFLDLLLKEVLEEDQNGASSRDHIAVVIKAINAMGSPDGNLVAVFNDVSAWFQVYFNALIKAEKKCWGTIECEVKGLNLSSEDISSKEHKARWDKHLSEGRCFDITDAFELISAMDSKSAADKWLAKAKAALDAKQARFEKAKAEVKTSHSKGFYVNVPGQGFRAIVVESDNDQMSAAARHQGYGIVIQKNSAGNVQVFTNRKDGIDLKKATALLRDRECELRGLPQLSWDALKSVGSIKQLPMWFLHDTPGHKNALYNGTLTADGVEPTLIPLDEIKKLVATGIQDYFLEQDRIDRQQKHKSSVPKQNKGNGAHVSAMAKA